ncbi:MAG: DUF2235 domain-containing protein [Myxococcota bacterium]
MTEIGEGVSVPPDPLSVDLGAEEPADEATSCTLERIKVRISVFFDGTLNNRANTRYGQANDPDFGQGSSSYHNELSNVARLEEHVEEAPEYDYSTSIYVEGIATRDDRRDLRLGSAYGMWRTGVRAKVERGKNAAIRWLRRMVGEDVVVETLTFDAFGFSRGAAAARNFIHVIREAYVDQTFAGMTVEELEFGFVGLYDTVASYGGNHGNDTEELQLDAVQHARFVLQLAAAEEYRENFPLTNIVSAPEGRQIYLPGSHSDVGGGYVDGGSEDKALCGASGGSGRIEAEGLRRKVLAENWYRRDETRIVRRPSAHNRVDRYSLRVRREDIAKEYSYIPLHVMADFAIEHGMNIGEGLRRKFKIPSDLAPIKGTIDAHIANNEASTPEHWQGVWTIANFRHDYLHFSGSEDIGMGVRFVDHRPEREVHEG